MGLKLEKVQTQKTITVPFKFSTFFVWFLGSVIISAVSLLIIKYIPQIGLTGIVALIVVFLLPSLVAYDVFTLYNDEYNIPKLKHPNKVLILLINLIFGITGIGWLIALAMSLSPGTVTVTSVHYIKR